MVLGVGGAGMTTGRFERQCGYVRNWGGFGNAWLGVRLWLGRLRRRIHGGVGRRIGKVGWCAGGMEYWGLIVGGPAGEVERVPVGGDYVLIGGVFRGAAERTLVSWIGK